VGQPPSDGAITRLLGAIRSGDADALNELTSVVYPELRKLAAAHLRRERPGHTLQATALVHELYVLLLRNQRIAYNDRVHFFAVSARLMRRILVDHARARKAHKRGAAHTVLSLDDFDAPAHTAPIDVLVVEDALERLSKRDARMGQIVEMRVFGGLDVDEASAVLAVSPSTVKRDWRLARAWLSRELRRTGTGSRAPVGTPRE
jgi:RNA polymerase sigma factor (TIGR02999 family)